MERDAQADAKVRAERSSKPNGESATKDEARSTTQLPIAHIAKIETHGDEIDSETLAARLSTLEFEIQEKILRSYVLDGKDITQGHITVLKVIARGIAGTTPEAAKEAARQLNVLCPPLNQTGRANNWIYMVWLIMLDIVADIGSIDTVQECCVHILEELVQCAKGMMDVWGSKLRVWRDLPIFPTAFDQFWENDPTTKFEAEKLDPVDVQSWKNISCFAARLMRSGLASDYDQAIIALRIALEEDMNTLPGFADCRTQVACLWIKHASKFLLRWALENPGLAEVAGTSPSYLEAGPLYGGPAIMCPQRWGFWIERLEMLGKEASVLEADTREMALQAARTMRIAEKRVRRLLSA
ncbi:hypothetical protein CGLO_02410 [Colletotrichum gloeosporioides Cg-14]|uniref:Uncharacterized protein n=1 Tax=Colletotrichum gloeosporioides (strain Cg-14) TaxID=1237896 RepID=T0KYB4_COLGC|nr:hypothetical protein CGLO_02410 [Colletotrichum gloeosporioides Cg-14]